jgi:hypothetical protein
MPLLRCFLHACNNKMHLTDINVTRNFRTCGWYFIDIRITHTHTCTHAQNTLADIDTHTPMSKCMHHVQIRSSLNPAGQYRRVVILICSPDSARRLLNFVCAVLSYTVVLTCRRPTPPVLQKTCSRPVLQKTCRRPTPPVCSLVFEATR